MNISVCFNCGYILSICIWILMHFLTKVLSWYYCDCKGMAIISNISENYLIWLGLSKICSKKAYFTISNTRNASLNPFNINQHWWDHCLLIWNCYFLYFKKKKMTHSSLANLNHSKLKFFHGKTLVMFLHWK